MNNLEIKIAKYDKSKPYDFNFINECYDLEDKMHKEQLGDKVYYTLHGGNINADESRSELIDAMEDRDNNTFLLAVYNNKNAGFIHIVHSKDSSKIKAIYVTKPGLGIGRALMISAETILKDADKDSITLRVFKFNTNAINLYKKLGYKKISSDKYSILMMKSI